MSRTSTMRRLSVAYLLSLGWSRVSHNGVVDLYATCGNGGSGGLIVRRGGRDFACHTVSIGESSISLRGEFVDEQSVGQCTIMFGSLRQVYTRKA